MPGLIAFQRRWAVGSDDLVVPGAVLFTIHILWTIALGVVLGLWSPSAGDDAPQCSSHLLHLLIGHLVITSLSSLNELAICAVSMRGSILETSRRSSIQKLIYIRLLILAGDVVWLSLSVYWLGAFYVDCPAPVAKEALLGAIVSGWCMLGSILGTVWCTWDAAGRSWVKLKRYQRAESRLNHRRSGSANRNWRQRKVLRAYQESWNNRCRLLFCCMRPSDRDRSSFTDIARLLSDFFRELDVVPSDVVAGLVLLRQFQKIEQQIIVKQRTNDVYEFLSGVPITSKTQFLALNDPAELEMFQTIVHYMHYALGAYGWPMFLMTTTTSGACVLCASLKCCCTGTVGNATVVHDNCCQCNYTALRHLLQFGDVDITYATYHVDVAETPFFIAVDHEKKAVVVSIRGTLSMKDVMTDLNAESEPIPVTPPMDDWYGHKGMVQAADYIQKKLEQKHLLERAFNSDPSRNTTSYQLILVGHSLGAGTAAILAILLRQEYPNLKCFSYSPPGGLLSLPAVEYTKEFTTSVVLGKDVVPRIGLYQLEALRADLINAIQRSVDPKWKTIICSAVCCCDRKPSSAKAFSSSGATGLAKYQQAKDVARSGNVHPESGNTLTLHRPLFPPGKILHLVRHHPGHAQRIVKKREPVYQAIWADNRDFDEVLISPGMIQDHMPDKVLEALNKVIKQTGPKKPQRSSVGHVQFNPRTLNVQQAPAPHRICLETSFTSLQNPSVNVIDTNSSKNSSVVGSLHNSSSTATKLAAKVQSPSQLNSILSYDFASLLDEQLNMASTSRTLTPSNVSARFMNQPLGIYNFASASNGVSYRQKDLGNAVRIDPVMCGDPKVSYVKERENCKVDLIHDDWFGLAPLASPESLSELSSISSRTSLNQSHEKCLNVVTVASVIMEANSNNESPTHTETLTPEYAMSTPKVLRRTPKICGNLSTAADDIRNVVKYQKMNQNFRFLGRRPDGSLSNSSRESSFESATSAESGQLATVRSSIPVVRSPLKYVPSLDKSESPFRSRKSDGNCDEFSLNVKEGFRSAENFLEGKSSGECFVTKSDPNFLENILEPRVQLYSVERSSNSITKDVQYKGSVRHFDEQQPCKSQVPGNSVSTSSELFLSTKSSMHSYASCEVQHSSPNNRKLSLVKDKCLYSSSFSSEGSPLHSLSKGEGARLLDDSETEKTEIEQVHNKDKKSVSLKKKCKSSSDKNIAKRNESLPLLSNIGNTLTHSPPASYVKRKKYVYPVTSAMNKSESNNN